MNAWNYTHLPSTIIRSERPEDLLPFSVSGRVIASDNSLTALEDYVSRKECISLLRFVVTFVGTCILDTVARLFALPAPNRLSADQEFSLPPEVTAYSLYTSQSAVEWGREWASFVQPGAIGTVRKITEHHAMKLGGEPQQEMQAIDLISSSTEIPVPKAAIVQTNALILTLIPGVPLSRCWDKLGPFVQFRIFCTLRTYIRQLSNLPTSEKPGPMVGLVRGALFEHEDIYNVFPTWMRFQCWCEALGSRGWNVIARLAKQEPSLNPVKPLLVPFSSKLDYRRLVFTRGDIHPGNLILDIDGHLWMIDWDDSGYYSIWFEA
ncbi:hypothetical protein PIIN_08594 [Serendipita indica DSM 11827]|uniref:Aminoglycoside phosphotransferase domain-containing protein n=1 Tax=Serendipita indica (strain DSM 11827) TaxID=1109443 RepID=G4TTJ9_SERID|nr:hypothetical protein PIIN_08594 [Serendipita indica DSM 11827]